jgi:hypothetical protein
MGVRPAVAVTLAAFLGVVAFCWPFLVAPGRVGATYAPPLIFGLLLALVLAVVLAEIADGGIDAKALAMLGVLSAIGAALRPLGAGTAGIETVFFVLVLGGRVFGPADFMASVGIRSLDVGGQPAGYTGGDVYHYALMRILIAARARGLQAIDGPYLKVRDVDGFRRSAGSAAALGYDGKWGTAPGPDRHGQRGVCALPGRFRARRGSSRRTRTPPAYRPAARSCSATR